MRRRVPGAIRLGLTAAFLAVVPSACAIGERDPLLEPVERGLCSALPKID